MKAEQSALIMERYLHRKQIGYQLLGYYSKLYSDLTLIHYRICVMTSNKNELGFTSAIYLIWWNRRTC